MWQAKANQIIGELCRASWRAANVKPDGTRRKRHVPYSVPAVAAELVECLRTGDELGAKSWFHTLAVIPELAKQ